MSISWDGHYAQRTRHMQSSAIREILKITELPDVISFAGGLPAPELFPVEAVAEAAQLVLAESGPQALQYSTTEGFRPLREIISGWTAASDATVSLDNILITSGSQQALDLLGKIFIDPGDRILVESPTYLGALQAWTPYGAEYVAVPADDHGMITDALEEKLQSRPKFIYVLSNFQNPTGVTLTLERRRQLVALADRYGIPIVEDDPYGQLRFEGEHLPTVFALDAQMRGGAAPYQGNVIYLSTFSKILAPGLRLAWVIAPPAAIGKLVQAKQGADLHTPTFNQMIAYEVAREGVIDRHIPVIRRVYRERRDLMLASMAEHFPAGVRWTRPEGGLFLWVELPEGMNAVELLSIAVARKVAFVPGAPFFPNGGGENTMRLNFSNAGPEMIRTGIARLGRALHEQHRTA